MSQEVHGENEGPEGSRGTSGDSPGPDGHGQAFPAPRPSAADLGSLDGPFIALANPTRRIEAMNRASESELTFQIVGGWGHRGEERQAAVARGMAKVARDIGCHAVLTIGDNFDGGVRDIHDDHWRASFEEVYADESLQVPWYAALGRQDYAGSCDALTAYTRASPRWRLPAPYYFVTLGRGDVSADIVFLDTTPFLYRHAPYGIDPICGLDAGSVPEQIGFLVQSLVHGTSRWRVVVGHHPILSGSGPHGGTEELDDRLRPILEELGVNAYVSGHQADLQHLVSGSVHYVVSGAAGGANPSGRRPETRFSWGGAGFAALTLTPDVLLTRFYDPAGCELYRSPVRLSWQSYL